MSDLLLQIIAIRLAALVFAGLVLQALPQQPGRAASNAAISAQRHAPVPEHIIRADAVTLALRDMQLHD
jgi:hypothetical protein